ncbi:MAG: NrfD/PsrC family molybdoenzyme membrane anchor subunit [Chloroflexota bacterium]
MDKASARYVAWLAVLGIAILAGLFTAYKLLTEGLGALGGTDVVIWPMPIAAYIFFALTSTGLTFVASMPLVFGLKQYEPIAKRAVFLGIASLLAAFAALSIDLGSMANLYFFLISPNISSPIWWMGVLYALELAMLLAKLWLLHKGDWQSRTSKTIGILAFISAIAASATLGLVFGTIGARPAYFGAFAPVYFMVTALLSGLAVIVLFSLAYYRLARGGLPAGAAPQYNSLGKILAYVTGFTLVLFLLRTIVGSLLSGSAGFMAFDHLVDSFTFQLVLWLGLVIPMLLLLIPAVRATTGGKVTAAALILLGLFIERMDYVLVGQLEPLGVRAMDVSGLASPGNTVWEWLVVAASLAILLFAYTLGERYLKLEARG